MSDAEVLDLVAKARRAYKSAFTRANKRYNVAANEAVVSFGSTDVEQAARSCAIRRADRARWDAITAAETKYRTALVEIKMRAGMWADLVPEAI